MRSRHFGLREISAAATAFLLVVTACSADESDRDSSTTVTTATPPTTVGSTDPPPVTSTTTTTSTAVPAPPVSGVGETLLVVGDDGVYQIGADGDVTLLVKGPVAYAVDDTQGGLLFQVERGRTGNQQAGRSTIVWWLPRGASTPQELLVPTPGAGHRLSLHDAYSSDDGFAVLYSRHEGVTPYEMTDRLRRFEVPAREVTELYSSGAFEHGYRDVSTNGELIAGVWIQQIGSGCFIYDLDGQPTDLVPEEASDRTSEDDVRGCRLSPNGNQLVFTVEEYDANDPDPAMLHVWDLIADTGRARFVVPGSVGTPRDIDLSTTKAVATFGDYNSQQTLVFEFNAPESDPVALPIVGRARFVDTPVDIGAPVHVGAGPHYYRYGDNGLYRVANGSETEIETQPVTWAVDDLMGGVIYRLHWQLDPETTYWLRADGSHDTLIHDPRFVADIEGEPTAVMIVSDDLDADMFDEDVDMLAVNLRSGSERRMPNIGFDGDGWSFPRSYGEGVFVGVDGAAVGCGYSDAVISFWDAEGNRIDHPLNPVAEPCGPCELSAAISPNGQLLAYSRRADAPSDYHGRMVCGGRDEWWNQTQDILADVVVLDLGTGDEVFRVTAPARASVADFDGRYVVVDQGDWVEDQRSATIYDSWRVHDPVEVEGGAALIRQSPNLVLRHDGLGVVSFGDPVDDVIAVLTELLGPPDLVESQISADIDVSVQWDHPFLYLQFTYWDYFDAAPQPPEPMPAGPVFHYYLVKSGGFATEAGFAVGDTVGDLRLAHPSVRFVNGCYETEREFVVDPPDGWPQLAIWGLLSGEPTNDHTTIEYIGAGWDRSPC